MGRSFLRSSSGWITNFIKDKPKVFWNLERRIMQISINIFLLESTKVSFADVFSKSMTYRELCLPLPFVAL